MSRVMEEQIDLIAEVASAFSEFAKLPEKEDAILNLNEEIKKVIWNSFNKKITIKVEDNGSGIEKEKLEADFEGPIYTKSSGMGLGLTMVRKMIEEYRGTISVKSDPGKGTQFTISLPDKEVFRVGTDGVLLGALCNAENVAYALEVGCGTGLISLMLAQRFPLAVFDALDINTKAVDLTRQKF
ncbi:hypothetical protein FQR65_LT16293 [Abscondita terminalis]|nr:hypothetical protein FQR65_LT16293 [Abscondita terminalis]